MAILTLLISSVVAFKDGIKIDEVLALRYCLVDSWLPPEQQPFIFMLFKFWSKVFGTSLLALRSLTILFFIPTVLCFYSFSRKFFNINIAIVSSTLLILNAFILNHSIYIHAYTIFLLLSILSFIFFYRATTQINSKKNFWLLYLVSLIAIFFHHFFYLIIGAQALALFFLFKRKTLRFLPLLPPFGVHLFFFAMVGFNFRHELFLDISIVNFPIKTLWIHALGFINWNGILEENNFLFIIIFFTQSLSYLVSLFYLFFLKKKNVFDSMSIILILASFFSVLFFRYYLKLDEIVVRYYIFLFPILIIYQIQACVHFFKNHKNYALFILIALQTIGCVNFLSHFNLYSDNKPVIEKFISFSHEVHLNHNTPLISNNDLYLRRNLIPVIVQKFPMKFSTIQNDSPDIRTPDTIELLDRAMTNKKDFVLILFNKRLSEIKNLPEGFNKKIQLKDSINCLECDPDFKKIEFYLISN